jgi:hypothetical protein
MSLLFSVRDSDDILANACKNEGLSLFFFLFEAASVLRVGVADYKARV